MEQEAGFKHIRRAIIVALAVTAVLLAGAAFALRVPAVAALVRELPIGPDVGPTPLPPIIAAQAGPLPAGMAGVRELAQYDVDDYRDVGSGFFLRLPTGIVIGVTTAHSLADLGRPNSGLHYIALALPGQYGHLANFKDLYGQPGVAFSGDDLSVDFVLLQLDEAVDPALPQDPDPRGGPQPGERVALYSGLGGAGAQEKGVRVLLGTVMSSTPTAVWLLMDDNFEPGGMSGSPVLSAYTGRVVGMAVAAARQHGRVLIGLNPIGAIVRHAGEARTFPAIAGYTR